MYGKNLVDKCKNYLKIPMTGLFAWHVSIHFFGRYHFHQWNVLFQKMIWNIYHHWNQAWFGLAAYFCCHAFPWLILKKEIFQKAFHAEKAKKYFFVIFAYEFPNRIFFFEKIWQLFFLDFENFLEKKCMIPNDKYTWGCQILILRYFTSSFSITRSLEAYFL